MKLTKKESKIQGSGFSKEHKFSIGESSVIIEILRSKLYSRPLQTAIQEYLSNARDASREAGTKSSICINIPNKIEPVFKVRDFGLGLSPERVSEVFVKYGSSTKRKDNAQTGGFGIGAKSAWAYTDSFTVVSVFGGKKYTYLAHLGSNPEGSLDLIDEEDSTEETGVEVSFGVQEKDILEATSAIFRCTNFWDEKPQIKGMMEVEIPQEYLSPLVYKSKDFFLTKKLSPWFNFLNNKAHHTDLMSLLSEKKDQSSSFWALVDGIPYSLESVVDSSLKENFYNTAVFLTFKTGDLQINANREELVFNPEVKEMIKNRLLATVEEIKSKVKSRISVANSISNLKRLVNAKRIEFSSLSSSVRFDTLVTIKEKVCTVTSEGNGNYSMTLPDGDQYSVAPFSDHLGTVSLTQISFSSIFTSNFFNTDKAAVTHLYKNRSNLDFRLNMVVFTGNPSFYDELKDKNQSKFDVEIEKIKNPKESRKRSVNVIVPFVSRVEKSLSKEFEKEISFSEKYGVLVTDLSQNLLRETPSKENYVYLVRKEIQRHGRNWEGFENEIYYACAVLGKKVVMTDFDREENLIKEQVPNLQDLYKERELPESVKEWLYTAVPDAKCLMLEFSMISHLVKYLPQDLKTEVKKVVVGSPFSYNLSKIETLFPKDFKQVSKEVKVTYDEAKKWLYKYSFLLVMDYKHQNINEEIKKLMDLINKK